MLSLIPIAVGTVVLTVFEKAPAVAHAALHTRVAVGLIVAAPAIALAAWLEYRKKARGAGKPASRRHIPFGGSR